MLDRHPPFDGVPPIAGPATHGHAGEASLRGPGGEMLLEPPATTRMRDAARASGNKDKASGWGKASRSAFPANVHQPS